MNYTKSTVINVFKHISKTNGFMVPICFDFSFIKENIIIFIAQKDYRNNI